MEVTMPSKLLEFMLLSRVIHKFTFIFRLSFVYDKLEKNLNLHFNFRMSFIFA